MRADRVFLEQVEEELRTTAAILSHERVGDGTGRTWHSATCRKCDLTSLADEAADRATVTA